jgi:hypothetical protein
MDVSENRTDGMRLNVARIGAVWARRIVPDTRRILLRFPGGVIEAIEAFLSHIRWQSLWGI